MKRLKTRQTMKLKLKTYIMRQRLEEQAEKELEAKRLRQEEQREQNLIELNELKEQAFILEKEFSEYNNTRDQLVKKLDIINKHLIEVDKKGEINYNRNTQETKEDIQEIQENAQKIKENAQKIKEYAQEIQEKAEKDEKYFNYHKAAPQNTVINAPSLYIPILPQNPAKTTATDSVLPAIPSNSQYFINRKLLPTEEDFFLPSCTNVFKSNPVTTIATDSVLPAVPSNMQHFIDHKAALPIEEDFVSSPLYVNALESESQSSTSLNASPSRVNSEPLPKTDLHTPTQLPLVPFENMSGDSHKHVLKKSSGSEKKKRKYKKRNKKPLKTTNVRMSKENRDINKQGIRGANSIENQQQPQDVRRGGITCYYPYSWLNVQLPPNRCPFSPLYPGVNANLRNSPMFCTHANSYVRPNCMPPLTCANRTPLSFPAICVGISHPTSCLPPIYTMSHVHPSFSCTCVSSSHIKSSCFFPPTYACHANPIPSLPPPLFPYPSTSRTNPTPSLPLPSSYASTSRTNPGPSITSHAKPSASIKPPSRKRSHPHFSAVILPVTCANTSHTNPPSSSHSFIDVNTSRANPTPLPPIICSTTSRVNPSPSVIQSNSPSHANPSPSINPPYRKQSYPYFTPISPPLPLVTNTSRVNSPMPPITCSTISRVNPSPSVIQSNTPSHANPSPSISPSNHKRVYPYFTSISSSLPLVTSTSRVDSPVPFITCSTTSRINLSPSIIQSMTSDTNSPSSPEVLIIDADASCANPTPLPLITCASTSRVNSPLPPIICSTTSRVNSPLPPIICSTPSRVKPSSSHSVIRITVIPVNPSSSLPS